MASHASYTITATYPSYETVSTTIQVLNIQETEPQGYLFGIIADTLGIPLENVKIKIQLSTVESYNVFTDSEGRYFLE